MNGTPFGRTYNVYVRKTWRNECVRAAFEVAGYKNIRFSIDFQIYPSSKYIGKYYHVLIHAHAWRSCRRETIYEWKLKAHVVGTPWQNCFYTYAK